MFSVDGIFGWFDHYVRSFEKDGELPPMLLLKKKHSRRVAAICAGLAEALGWDEDDDAETACAAGLLHDVGRFPQYRDHATFWDGACGLDHGDLGEEILRREFDWSGVSEKRKEAVLAAVKYHNKKDLPAKMALLPYKWACAVRDSDKIDIFRMIQRRIDNGTIFELMPRRGAEEGLSQTLVDEVRRDGRGSYSNAASLKDYRLIQLTWGCDLNFAPSAVTLLEEGIFDKICADLSGLGIDDLVKTLKDRVSAI